MNKISATKIIIQDQALRKLLLVMTTYKFVHTTRKYLLHLTEWVSHLLLNLAFLY